MTTVPNIDPIMVPDTFTIMQVTSFIESDWLIETEVDAVVGG